MTPNAEVETFQGTASVVSSLPEISSNKIALLDSRQSAKQDIQLRPPMVLHVRVVTGHGGGPEKTILNSPRFLRSLGYESKLAYLHPPGDPGIDTLVARGNRLDAEVVSIPDKGPLDLSVLWRLIRLCRHERVAIWHGHDYKSNLLGLLVRPFWRMKLVTTLHGWTNLTGRMPLYVKVDKWCLKYYRAAICVSDDLYDECQNAGVQRHKCYRVYNAIDTEDYQRRVSLIDAKRQLGAPQDSFLIGTVGRLSPEKGFDLLIRAVLALRQKGHRVDLWIAGDGGAHEDLQRLIVELGCGEFVRLLGHVSDPKLFYQAMDVFALSSIREGLPNVVLEAMALETPVVATRVAGVPTLIEDGASGLIVEPNSAQSLITGLEQLIVNPALSDSFRQEGRVRVESKFSFLRRMERVVSIYNEVLDGASS